METFSALLAIRAGNSPDPGEFPTHKGPWRGALRFSWICVWINGWVNNGEASGLRRHRAHYDVTVIIPHERWVFTDNLQLDYLISNLFRLPTKKSPKLCIVCPLWGETPMMRKAFSCHDDIMCIAYKSFYYVFFYYGGAPPTIETHTQ